MNLPQYEKHEKEFLEAKAREYLFEGKKKVAFIQRFRENNSEMSNKILAEEWESSLCEASEGKTTKSPPEIILRDCLKDICAKLEEAGCDFQGAKKNKWIIAKKWLREVQYPLWVQKQQLLPANPLQLWQHLVGLAKQTRKMGPVIVGKLDLWSEYEDCIPLGSNILLQVELERPGHLLLLAKGTSGRLLCLCPSFFAPQPLLPAGVASLPQAGQKSFKVTGNIGIEELIAVITPSAPALSWLPDGKGKPQQLHIEPLKELLDYLRQEPTCQVLYAEYTVTSS